MGGTDTPLGRANDVEARLREEGRRGREDAQRRAAMLMAERAELASANGEMPTFELSDEHKAHFGSQLSSLDQRTGSVPPVGAMLQNARLLRESRQFGTALRNAERSELRSALSAD